MSEEFTDVLRQEVRRLVARPTAEATLHQRTVDPAVAAEVADVIDRGLGQLEVATMTLPEELGGAGAGAVEAAIVLEETARSLVAPHLLAALGLALPALVAAGEQGRDAIPADPAATTFAVVWPGVTVDTGCLTVDLSTDQVRVSGTAPAVPGGGADALVVLVIPEDDGVLVATVAGAGCTWAETAALDLTRPVADLVAEGLAVTVVGRLDAIATRRLRAGWLVAVAAECLGGSDALLAQAIAFATTRTAFGRPIGSFQAVRHRCAEMFVLIETLRASVRVAARKLAEGGDDVLDDALTTASHALDVYASVGNTTLLVHGGIGFTYEADIHFHLRRAFVNATLTGRPEALRRELVARFG